MVQYNSKQDTNNNASLCVCVSTSGGSIVSTGSDTFAMENANLWTEHVSSRFVVVLLLWVLAVGVWAFVLL